MSTSYHHLGMLAQDRGDYDAAEPLYRRSLEIKERIGDQAGMAASYHHLGILAQDRGDYDAAEPLYRRSLEIMERIGDQAGMAASYDQLGMLAQDRGDYDAAEPLYRRSLEISERIGDQAFTANSYHNLGKLERGSREPGRGGRLSCGCPRHPAQDRHSHDWRPPGARWAAPQDRQRPFPGRRPGIRAG